MWTKVRYFLKHYWFVVLSIIATIVFFLTRRSYIAHKLLQYVLEGFDKEEVKVLNDLHEKEKKQKEELAAKYEIATKILQQKFDKDEKNLEMEELKKIRELMEKNSSKQLGKKLSELFGLEYSPGENND